MVTNVQKQVKVILANLVLLNQILNQSHTSNLLIYEGKFYSIGGHRLSVQMDKTINQDAFILSLPAIADAVNKAGMEGQADVILGVGLPIIKLWNT